jgi:hypothetical protein
MLYTVLVGQNAPNFPVLPIATNTFTQQIYLGISGRHNVKIKGIQFDINPDTAGLVFVRIDEFYSRLTNNTTGSYNLAFLTDGFIQSMTNMNFDLGIQNLNNYLTFTITTTAGGPITYANFLMFLEIEEETKYLLK